MAGTATGAGDDRLRAFYDDRVVCVTGGAGFIGSHLCSALAGVGARVRVIDDLSNGRAANLDPLGAAVDLIEDSILNEAAMRRATVGAAVIFHLAAVASVPRSIEEPRLYHTVNVAGTLNVLEAARAAGNARVVFASSSSVYGDQPLSPKVETMRLDPLSPYAASKAAGELYLRAWSASYGLPTVSLRYFNIFGPRQRADSPYAAVIPRFAAAMRAGQRPVVYGDGLQTRDFTHVDNAVRANLLAGATEQPLRGEALNIAAGEGRTVLELLEACAKHLGAATDHEKAPPRTGEVRHSRADVSAARELIGYEPVRSFDEGLALTLG